MRDNKPSMSITGWPDAYITSLMISATFVCIIFVGGLWFRGILHRDYAAGLISLSLLFISVYIWLEAET